MAEKEERNLSADSFGTDADSDLATALRVARSPKHDLTVAADVHETGKILSWINDESTWNEMIGSTEICCDDAITLDVFPKDGTKVFISGVVVSPDV